MALFSIYAGIIISRISPAKKMITSRKPIVTSLMLGISLIILSTIILYSQIQLVNNHLILKRADSLRKHKNLGEAIKLLHSLDKKLLKSESYRTLFGKALMESGNYKEAINQFEAAERLTSNPDIFIYEGRCYAKQRQRYEAERSYKVAASIEPSLLTPKYLLMKLYLQSNDTKAASLIAKDIMAITPKVPSRKATFYKKEAEKVFLAQTVNN